MSNLQEKPDNATWQPMSTAPKDGTMIIAHNAIIGGTYVVGWHKGNSGEDLEDVPHWSDMPNVNSAEALYFNHLYFTHWMPLPAHPTQDESDDHEAADTPLCWRCGRGHDEDGYPKCACTG